MFFPPQIGDAYVCCAGCPVPSEWHAAQIADMALCMREAMEDVRAHTGVPDLRVRIGIHSGPVTAGVIRANNRRFQLFGGALCLFVFLCLLSSILHPCDAA